MFDTDAYRFCVVGPGRLGSTLVTTLIGAGFAVPAVSGSPGGPTDPDAHPPRLALGEALRAASVIWLTVPDDAIAGVASAASAELGERPDLPLYALHSSGLGRLSLLEPLRATGVATLSLHPLQTFAAGGPRAGALDGVPCAITADGQQSSAFGAWLAERLGGRPFALADDAKPLYHLAAVVASNLFVALESEAADLVGAATSRDAVGGMELLAPIIAGTAANLSREGAARALTGPVARGDVGTVRGHLGLLSQRAPRFAATYRALSLQALSLAAPRLDDETVRSLRSLLEAEGVHS